MDVHRRGARFLRFLMANKIWWLVPILVVLSLILLVGLLASSGAVPTMYNVH